MKGRLLRAGDLPLGDRYRGVGILPR